EINEFVTGRALDRPVLAQHLVARENFLDDEVEGSGRLLAQAQQISFWIEQPVDVIDAQTVQYALAQKIKSEAVRLVEQFRQFHAQAGELIDVKEAPVIDV